MASHLYKNFLVDSGEYAASVEYWRRLWESIDQVARVAADWRTPWVHTGSPLIQDGNPIFSAYSPSTRRGVRVIQFEPSGNEPELDTWLDTFGGDIRDPDSITELVIACALSDFAAREAARLMESWVSGGGITAIFDTRRSRLEVEIKPLHDTTLVDLAA